MSPSNSKPSAVLPKVPSANWKALLSTIKDKPNQKRPREKQTETSPPTKKLRIHQNTKKKTTSSPAKEEQPSSNLSKVDPKDLWFDDISPADWELAYGKSEGASPVNNAGENDSPDATETILESKGSNSKLGKYVAMDCEMVGVGPEGTESALARVSIVNYHGAVILDKFVKPQEAVTDYRTFVSGITPDLLKNADDFKTVQAQVAEILKDRIIVGHGIHNDFLALLLNHPRTEIRDTQTYHHFKTLSGKKKPALRKLTALVLKKTIQQGSHSSVEDARHTMLLYQTVRTKWEGEIKAKQQGKKTKTSATTSTTNDPAVQKSVPKTSTKTKSVAVSTRTNRRK